MWGCKGAVMDGEEEEPEDWLERSIAMACAECWKSVRSP